MPAALTRDPDALVLDISSCRGSAFSDALAKIREIPGRRYDGDRKVWLLPLEPSAGERAIYAVGADADPSLHEWVRDSKREAERELVTPLPDDADDLQIPWAYERAPWQPAEINGEPNLGLQPHQRALISNLFPRALICDALGLGKSVQALSFHAECLVRYQHDYEFARVHSELSSEKSGQNPQADSGKCGEVAREDSKDNRRTEGSMRGLRDYLAAPMHRHGSRKGGTSFLFGALAVSATAARKNAGTIDSRGARQVRPQMSNMPSPQALAAEPKLIVCPKSVFGVWQREISRWAGEDSILATGSSSSARHRALLEGVSEGIWTITNYESLRIVKEKVRTKAGGTKTVTRMKEPLYEETKWLTIILDEAARLKNRKALQTKGAYRLKAPIMLGLTGTPIQNEPAEIWSLLHLLWPDQYKSYWRFFSDYVDYTEGYFGKEIHGVRNPDALRFELRSKVYRRTQKEVLDLPEKRRLTVPVILGSAQRKLYAKAERDFWLVVENDQRLAEGLAAGKSVYSLPNGAARTVRLRQILSTPALLEGQDDSAKLDAIEQAVVDNRHEPHIVFSEFVDTCHILAQRLNKHKLRVKVYTGETSSPARTLLEDEFQAGNIDVIIGTIGALKEGVTLTAASVVHFVERSWVPAWNEQAEDRCYRIGQRNAVTVFVYQATDTIDDGKIRPTNLRKEKIVSTVVQQDEIKESVA